MWLLALLSAVLMLAGCAGTPGQAPVQISQAGGSSSPEQAAESFFDDLRQALKDPQLADDTKRGQWVEQMASYFAPNERDDQRIALRSALDNFASGLGKLEPNENLSLDLKIERRETSYETDSRAMVHLINGSIDVLITRTTSTGVQKLYEDSVPLDKIIGSNGAVPVVRIGKSWYLTEG